MSRNTLWWNRILLSKVKEKILLDCFGSMSSNVRATLERNGYQVAAIDEDSYGSLSGNNNNAEMIAWDSTCCSLAEFSFVVDHFCELTEGLSRKSHLEPLKTMSIQEYYQQIKLMYVRLCRDVFRETPSMVFSGNIPHDCLSIVVCLVSWYRKVPYYGCLALVYCPRFAILRLDIRQERFGNWWCFGERIGYTGNSGVFHEELAREDRLTLQRFVDDMDNGGSYPRMKDIRPRNVPNIQDVLLRRGSAFKRVLRTVWAIGIHYKQYRFLKRYDSISVSMEDILCQKKAYIYMPWHLQPEMTTSALGGRIWNDQTIMTTMIAEVARLNNMLVVIKENPKQSFSHRESSVFRALAEEKNVVFVNRSTPSRVLIEGCDVVATTSGTAGVEGLRMGKKVFCWGTSWYESFEGTLTTLDELTEALAKKGGGTVKLESTQEELFVKELEAIAMSCWPGCSNHAEVVDHLIGQQKNTDRVSQSVLKAVETLIKKDTIK